MSEIGVLPLVVLGGGLLVGFAVAFTLSRREPRAPARADLSLRLADLEAERDEAYAKLRGGEGVSLTEADRDALELTAARILRDLDATRAELARGGAAAPRAPAQRAPGRAEPSRGFLARHPAVGGALLGGGLVGLVALLVFWAQRDARPAPPSDEARPMASGGAPSASERGEAPLPPQVAAEVAAMRERIAANPNDVGLRRSLAELLLSHGQFFDAFGESRQLLERAPEDAVGHYVSGVVRYTMGDAETALRHFASARAAEPGYTPAAIVEGIVLLQIGDREGAVGAWSSGLEAAGGGEPRLEHLLRLAREGRSVEEILATPPPG